MPEPTGPRRIRPKRLARQLLDEELKANTAQTRQHEPAAQPAWGPAPGPAARGSTSQAADDAADELLRLLREIWLRLLRYRRGQAAGPGGEDNHAEQSPPARSPEHYQAGPTEPWQPPHQQDRVRAPEHFGAQQPFSAPGFAQAPGSPRTQDFGQAPPFARQPGFAPQVPGYPAPPPGRGSAPPGRGFTPPPQQPDGRRRLMKGQPERAQSSFEQYGNLRPEQQAAVRKEVSKLIGGKTRYQVAASRDLLPFNVTLAQAVRSDAKTAEAPRSERSWLSRLTPWRQAKQNDGTVRSAAGAAAAAPDARMAAPPWLPQLPHYAGQTPVGAGTVPQRTPGLRPGDAVTQASSHAAVPARGNPAAHTQGPPVPPKVPIVPAKIPLNTPGAEPGRTPRSSTSGQQPPPPSSPVNSPASPTMPPVSPMSRPASPASAPASPVVPPSPSFSPAVAHQSLEHHRSNSQARGTDLSMSPRVPSRAPAAQQTDTVKRAPSRGR
ncbi:hypothetical protein [Streptomyces qinglanensis]|uniref:hypothetical protein n=1 Tax=Streptomyces qinglanensis TaxID=943816 RepID=UPI003D759935